MKLMKWQAPGIAYFGGGGGGGGTTAEEEEGQGTIPEAPVSNPIPTNPNISDPQQSYSEYTGQVTDIQNQIDTLLAGDQNDPQVQENIQTLTEQLNQATQNQQYAGQLVQNQMQEGQQDLVVGASTDPGSVVEKATTEDIVATPDTLIDQAVGEVQEPTPTAEVSTVDTVQEATTPEAQEAETVEATTVADQVSQATEGMEAATAQPSPQATVKGQLEELMSDFEGGGTPPWASGAMRKAMGLMQARGLGASSMAGAAVVQSAMESALAIAQQDAGTYASFEMQNLNNEQQTTVFKTQQTIAGLFSDQAAENASKQFNASSKNQTNQFFANLEANASQFNAAQVNAIAQFNAGETNAIEQFNANLEQQRQMFETQNALVIAQANAQWRQNISTINTAAKNAANMEYTKTVNAITAAQLDQIWQRERDLLDFAFTASESALDRANAIALQKLSNDASTDAIKLQNKLDSKAALGAFAGQAIGGLLGIL